MPASFSEIIKSRLFKFTVGENFDQSATSFSVHEKAIAELSQPLHSLVCGQMSEALAGCAVWPNVRRETFEMLVQFAYTGDYSIPPSEMLEKPIEPGNSVTNGMKPSTWGGIDEFEEWREKGEPVDEDDDWRGPHIKKKKNKKMVETYETETVRRLEYSYSLPRNNYPDCEPVAEFNPSQAYLNVLLGHATLYILADFWLVDNLKELALYKLAKTLRTMMGTDDMGEVIELAKRLYADDSPAHGARELVCRFLVGNRKALADDDRFLPLLRRGGQFVEDFFKEEFLRI